MLDLNNFTSFSQFDPEDMLGQIDSLPAQLESAWKLGMGQPLPELAPIRQVVVAGMGGSAIGADLLSAYVAPFCSVAVSVHRDYGLPAWVSGPETLVVASSHSGNTEETLSAYQQAREAGCALLVLSTGGRLAQTGDSDGTPVWRFEHRGQPRAAVGFSFGLLVAALERLGLIPPQETVVQDTAAEMRSQQETIGAASPTAKNPAKRMAGQLVGRYVTIFGSGILAPVARRWKGQLSEVAKAWAQFEYLPEADHNTLAGIMNPEELLPHMMALFLTAASDHPRNRLRSSLTRQAFMLEGINTDTIVVQGSQPMAQQWTGLHFGDYMAYYLAMAYGVDPTAIPAIENLKRDLG